MNNENGMRAIHPGEILREEFLMPLHITIDMLAAALHIPFARVAAIVAEEGNITPDIALRLARYFGTTVNFWLNLQTAHDIKIAVRTCDANEIAPYAAMAES